jgi:nucleoside-diphosphate-sugar epimerase
VKQLIYSSSASIYGGYRNNHLWLKETDPLRPGRYRYSRNKKMIVDYFSETKLRDDLHIVILHICTVVGPSYDKPRSVVSLLIRFPYLPRFCRNNIIQFLHEEDMSALFRLVLLDDEVRGVFNLAPDSFSEVRYLLPDKKYIRIPIYMMKSILWILWNLKILNLQPSSLNNSIYPIILDSSKLSSRYGYRFKHSSNEAFFDTASNNKIPEDSLF